MSRHVATALTAALVMTILLTSAATGSASAPGQQPPTNLAPPTILGTAQVGSGLTASTGTWQRVSSYAYQWLRCDSAGASCGALGGAAASAYKVSPGDAGYTLRALVTATNKNGSAAAVSAATAVVSPGSQTPDTTITNLSCGTSLSAFPNAVCIDGNDDGGNSASLTFTIANASSTECQMDGAAYSPCTSGTVQFWVPVGGSHTLYVRAKRSTDGAVDSSPASASLMICPTAGCPSSTAPAPSPTAPSLTSSPAISGTVQQGQTLSASTGSWGGTTPMSYAYQWQRCSSSGTSCSPLAGATGSSYLLASADVGSTMRVSVTASNAAGSATASSLATAVVAVLPSGQTASPWWSRTFESPESVPQPYPFCCGTYWNTLLVSSASTGAEAVDPTNGSNHVFDSHVANSAEYADWSLITQIQPTAHTGQGGDTWRKFRIYFPATFKPVGYRAGQANSMFNWLWQPGHDSASQSKCSSEDTGNQAIGILNSNAYADNVWYAQMYGGQQTTTNCIPSKHTAVGPTVHFGRWYTLVEHVKYSYGSDGLYELWVDGAQAFNIAGPNLYRHPDGSIEVPYEHYGYYRWNGGSSTPTTWAADVYYDDITEGPTRDSVGG
jgi:hypothetical protein